MSDPTQADQSAETAQGAVESTHPWGDDFQPERAWGALQNSRATEKELKERLQSEQSVWDDEDALLARIAEKYPHLVAEEESSDDTINPDDYEDPSQAELAQVRQELAQVQEWRQQQEYQAARVKYDQHYSELASKAKAEHGVELPAEVFADAVLSAASNDPKGVRNDTVEAAFNKLVDWAKAQRPQDQTPPSVPSPPPSGRQGAVDHKPGDRKSRQERMAAAMLSQQQ